MAFRISDSLFHKEKNIRYLIFSLLGLSVLFVLLALSFFNNPSSDDFNYSVVVRQHGFFGAQYYWYSQYCGRYFSTFLLSMNPLIFGSFMGYKLTSFILIILSFISFYILAGRVFSDSRFIEKLYVAVILFFCFIMLMPSLPEGYYWFTGAYSYQMGNILTVFLVLMMIDYSIFRSKKVFIVSVILVAMIAGLNEYSMLVMVVVLLILNIVVAVKKKKPERYYIVLFIVGIAGFLTDLLAPGNYYRASFNPDKHQFFFSLKNSLIQTVDVLSNWWWVGVLIAAAVYIIASSQIISNSKTIFNKIYLNPFIIIILLIGVIAGGFFPCYWSLGLYPPMRGINNIYFYFIAGSFYLGICTAVFLNKYKIFIPGLKIIQTIIPVLIVVYLFLFPGNINRAYHDLIDGTASSYNSQLEERYTDLIKSDCRVCPVRKLTSKPKTLFFSDISEETDYAMIESFFVYFRKDGVYVENK